MSQRKDTKHEVMQKTGRCPDCKGTSIRHTLKWDRYTCRTCEAKRAVNLRAGLSNRPRLQIDIDNERGYKVCKDCNKNKKLEAFGYDSTGNRYRAHCLNCGRIRAKKIRGTFQRKPFKTCSCKECGKVKTLSEFPYAGRNGPKTTTHSATCKICYGDTLVGRGALHYARYKLKKNPGHIFRKDRTPMSRGGACKICGSTDVDITRREGRADKGQCRTCVSRRQREAVDTLSTTYVKRLIRDSVGVDNSDIPIGAIETKRAMIEFKRELKQWREVQDA